MKVRRRQKGVGLVEVLIAVLVLSVGMLGMAVLQVRSLRNNQSAYQRSVAVMQVHAIADAMRSERNVAINGGFDLGIDEDTPEDPATFPQVALADWRAGLVELLGPDASGSVACNGSLCTVTVVWNDERGSDGDAEMTLETQLQL